MLSGETLPVLNEALLQLILCSCLLKNWVFITEIGDKMSCMPTMRLCIWGTVCNWVRKTYRYDTAGHGHDRPPMGRSAASWDYPSVRVVTAWLENPLMAAAVSIVQPTPKVCLK